MQDIRFEDQNGLFCPHMSHVPLNSHPNYFGVSALLQGYLRQNTKEGFGLR